MLDPHLVFLGAAFSIAGSARYVVLTLRGRTVPNRVTWFLWALAPLIGFAAQTSDGVGLPAVLTLSVAIGPAAIFVASFFNPSGFWRLTRFDVACGLISLAALVVWLSLRDPTPAVVFSVLADLAAGVPTVVKAWRQPETETPLVYAFAAINGIIALLTIDRWTLSTWIFPAYIAALGVGLSALVIARGRMVRSQRART